MTRIKQEVEQRSIYVKIVNLKQSKTFKETLNKNLTKTTTEIFKQADPEASGTN